MYSVPVNFEDWKCPSVGHTLNNDLRRQFCLLCCCCDWCWCSILVHFIRGFKVGPKLVGFRKKSGRCVSSGRAHLSRAQRSQFMMMTTRGQVGWSSWVGDWSLWTGHHLVRSMTTWCLIASGEATGDTRGHIPPPPKTPPKHQQIRNTNVGKEGEGIETPWKHFIMPSSTHSLPRWAFYYFHI